MKFILFFLTIFLFQFVYPQNSFKIINQDTVSENLNQKDTLNQILYNSNNREEIVVSVLLPFYSSLINDEDFNIESLVNKSYVSLELYKGIMIAYDSLSRLGYSINLNIFDTYNDSLVIDSISKLDIIKKSSIIFGPLFSDNFNFFATKKRFNNKKLISPLSFKDVVYRKNFAYQTTPSEEIQMDAIASFVQSRHNGKKVIILGNNQNLDNVDYLYNSMKKMDSLDIITHIYSDIDSVHNSRIHDLEILDEDENIIIIPSVNKNFVSANISVLSTMKDTSFVVFGFNVWDSFDNLDFEDLEFLNVHYIKLKCLTDKSDYSQFVSMYKERYYSFPSYFALSAFRQFMFFINDSYDNLFDFRRSFGSGYQNVSFDFVTQYRYKQIVVE